MRSGLHQRRRSCIALLVVLLACYEYDDDERRVHFSYLVSFICARRARHARCAHDMRSGTGCPTGVTFTVGELDI